MLKSRCRFSAVLAVAGLFTPIGAAAGAPSTEDASSGSGEIPTESELRAMLLSPLDVEGYHDHPDFGTDGDLPVSAVCPDAGAFLLIGDGPRAGTSLDYDAWEVVAQILSSGPEPDQRIRFDEATAALDTCDGVSFEVEDGTVEITLVHDASLPVESQMFRSVYVDESGYEIPYHIVYALVGPVIVVLWFDRVETHDALMITNRALAKVAEATGSSDPPATVGPPVAPAAAVPDGYVEQAPPAFVDVPVSECATEPTVAPIPAPPPAALPVAAAAEPAWVATACITACRRRLREVGAGEDDEVGEREGTDDRRGKERHEPRRVEE
jgi:hypothetical protein